MSALAHGGNPNRRRINGRAVWALASIAAAATAVILSGCNTEPKADLMRGQQLFTQKCGSCHTLTGAGTNGDVGPNLDYAFKQARANGMDSDTIRGVILAQVENPRPAAPQATDVYMPPKLVEGQELNDVATYVASVAGVPGIKAPVFQPPQFFATNCGGCHTLSAAGTTATIGPNLTTALTGQAAAEISQSITTPNAKITPGYPPNVMPQNFGQILTPPQLAALVKYLQSASGGGK
jgi:mono/diheme cytochrome c family protein